MATKVRPPTMVRGSFRLRYRVRDKIDRLLFIDYLDGSRYALGVAIIDLAK